MNKKTDGSFFRVGDEITFTSRLKFSLATHQCLIVPIGTKGQVLETSPDGAKMYYLIQCAPSTVYEGFEPKFWAEHGDLSASAARTNSLASPIKPESPDLAYDEDVPGAFREDGAYYVEEDEAGGDTITYLLYRRKAFTDWEIYVQGYGNSISLKEVDGVYRTAYQEGKECERFTLLPKDSEMALIQINILARSRVQVWATVPCEVEIDNRKKRVDITLLFSEVTHKKDGVISTTFVESY